MARKDTLGRRLKFRFLRAFVPLVLRLLGITWSFRHINPDLWRQYMHTPGALIVAFWHQDIVDAIWLARDSGMVFMSSQSRDGELSAAVGSRLGYRTVRGGSSAGGMEALKKLVGVLKQGGKTAMAVDGPRGPAREAKIGSIVAAKRGGVPMMVYGCWIDRAIILGNWDRTRIPLPFARIRICFEGPITIPANARGEELEEIRLLVGERINQAEERARRG